MVETIKNIQHKKAMSFSHSFFILHINPNHPRLRRKQPEHETLPFHLDGLPCPQILCHACLCIRLLFFF